MRIGNGDISLYNSGLWGVGTTVDLSTYDSTKNPYVQLQTYGLPGDGTFLNVTLAGDEYFDTWWTGVTLGGACYKAPTGHTDTVSESGTPGVGPYDGFLWSGNQFFLAQYGTVDNFSSYNLKIYDGTSTGVTIGVGTYAARNLTVGLNLNSSTGQVSFGTVNETSTSVWDPNTSTTRFYNILMTTNPSLTGTATVLYSSNTNLTNFDINSWVWGTGPNDLAFDTTTYVCMNLYDSITSGILPNNPDETVTFTIGTDNQVTSFFKTNEIPTTMNWKISTLRSGQDQILFSPNTAYRTFLSMTDLQTGVTQTYQNRNTPNSVTLNTHGGKPVVHVRLPDGTLHKLRVTGSDGAWTVNADGYDLSYGIVVENPFDQVTGSAMNFNNGSYTINGVNVTYTQVNHRIQDMHRRYNLAPHNNYDNWFALDTSLLKSDSNAASIFNTPSEFFGDDYVFTSGSGFPQINTDTSGLSPTNIVNALRTAVPGKFTTSAGAEYVYLDTGNFLRSHAGLEWMPLKNSRVLTIGGDLQNYTRLESGNWKNLLDNIHLNPYLRLSIPENRWFVGDIAMGGSIDAFNTTYADLGESGSGSKYMSYHGNQLGTQAVLFPYSAVSLRAFWDAETFHENFGSLTDSDGTGRKSTERAAGIGTRIDLHRRFRVNLQYTSLDYLAYYNSDLFGLNMFGLAEDFLYRKGRRYEGSFSLMTADWGIHNLGCSYTTYTYPGADNPNDAELGLTYQVQFNNWKFNLGLEKNATHNSYSYSTADGLSSSSTRGWNFTAGMTYIFPTSRD